MFDYEKAVQGLYDALEEDRVEDAVMRCVRIARHAQDYLNACVFIRHLHSDHKNALRVMAEDMAGLKPEASRFFVERSGTLWQDTHDVGFNMASGIHGEEKRVFTISIGDVDAELNHVAAIEGVYKLPSGLGEFDTAAFYDRSINDLMGFRLRARGLSTLRARIKARCFEYAITIERQLQAQRPPVAFLHDVQMQVNNYFKGRDKKVYDKLRKAAEIVYGDNAEDHALVLTEIRRAINAVADHLYPPRPEPVLCSDGQTRKLGPDQYLNRLEQFLSETSAASSTATELLKAEFGLLMVFVRRLNSIASKGVHADVEPLEARQGLVGIYLFLYSLTRHLELNQPDSTGT